MSKQATLSIVAANTAKQAPAAKPASTRARTAANTAAKPKATWNVDMIANIATDIITLGKASEAKADLAKHVKFLRDNKITLGKSRRTCAISKELHAAFQSHGVSDATAANYLTAFRVAVNEGKEFNLNPARAAGPKEKKSGGVKKAAKTTWSTSGEVLAAIAAALVSVSDKCSPALWAKAMADAPHGFDDTIADFLESQAATEE